MAELVYKTYAASLFEVSLSNNNLDEIYSEFQVVTKSVYDNPKFLQIMSSPIIEKAQKHEIIANVFIQKVSYYFLNFMKILIDNSRFASLEKIFEEFENMYNDYKNIAVITVITATELSLELKEKLIKKLEQVTAKTVKLTSHVDSEIIGGVMLKYKNGEIDATVKTELMGLKAKLKNIIA